MAFLWFSIAFSERLPVHSTIRRQVVRELRLLLHALVDHSLKLQQGLEMSRHLASGKHGISFDFMVISWYLRGFDGILW